MEIVVKELKFHKHKWTSMLLFLIVTSFSVTAALAESMNRFYSGANLPVKTIWWGNPFQYLPSGLNILLAIMSWIYFFYAFSKFQTKKSDYSQQLTQKWKSYVFSILRGIGGLAIAIVLLSSSVALGIVIDHLEPNQTSRGIFFLELIFFGIYCLCFYLRKFLVNQNLNSKRI